MNAQLLSDFPGDALARPKYIKFEISREEALERDSFGRKEGLNSSKLITDMINTARLQHEARGR